MVCLPWEQREPAKNVPVGFLPMLTKPLDIALMGCLCCGIKTANGLPLASNSQTSANYGTSQDNLETLELDEENLETVCQKLFDVCDENGKRAGMNPDLLIVPTALRKKALEIVGSTGKSDTADNNMNVYDGNIRVLVWDQFRRQSRQDWTALVRMR